MNNVSLIGRLTKDPEIRYGSTSQTAIARYNLAVTRPGAKEGEQQADFISCVSFGKTAELIEKYVTKGKLIGITGRIQTGSYEKDGKKYYTTDVVAERIEFLDKSEKNTAKAEEAPAPSSMPEGFESLDDDDIPF